LYIYDNVSTTYFCYFLVSNWGCDNGKCGKGFGPQEHFLGCADVSISPERSTTQAVPSVTSYTPGSVVIDSTDLLNKEKEKEKENVIGMFSASVDKPKLALGFVPIRASNDNETFRGCVAAAGWRAVYPLADAWCRQQCAAGACSALYCTAGCLDLVPR